MTTWHKGPPPEIGWWPAGDSRDREIIRWWDGRYWSFFAKPSDSAEYAAQWAVHKFSELDRLNFVVGEIVSN